MANDLQTIDQHLAYRERDLVTFILSAFQKAACASDHSSDQPIVTYWDDVTIDSINALYPELLYRFVGGPVRLPHAFSDRQMAHFFRRPLHSTLYFRYREMLQTLPPADRESKIVAMLFRWGKTPLGWCMYNDAYYPPKVATHVNLSAIDHLTVVRTKGFIKNIAANWQIHCGRVIVAFDAQGVIPDDIQRKLGTDITARLFAVLRQYWTHLLPAEQAACVRIDDSGIRWVHISHGELAKLLRCSPSSVKEGFRRLKKAGYVESRRMFEGIRYRVIGLV